MTSSEPSEPRPGQEQESSQEQLERKQLEFRKRVDDAVEFAEEQQNVTVTALIAPVQDLPEGRVPLYEHIAENSPNVPKRMHPASTVKMAQAIYLASKLRHLTAEQLNNERAVNWGDFVVGDKRRKGDFIDGGGEYDKAQYKKNPKLRHASYRALADDMLGPGSGNMAQKILMGRDSSEEFNAFWQEIAPTVRMQPAGERGWFVLEEVSPRDMLRVAVYASQLEDTPVGTIIREAMTGGSGKEGTVSGALDEDARGNLLTKTGDLPPDDEDPYYTRHYTRHDVGVLGDYAYVIMTQSPDKKAMMASQELIEKIGAYMAHEQGYSTIERAQRKLGGNVLGRAIKRFSS